MVNVKNSKMKLIIFNLKLILLFVVSVSPIALAARSLTPKAVRAGEVTYL